MQNKEPKRGDPSGYAFGVKCSATPRVKATQRRTIQNEFESYGRVATWFPVGKPQSIEKPCGFFDAKGKDFARLKSSRISGRRADLL